MLIHIGYHKTGTTWLQKFLFHDQEAGFCKPWAGMEIRDRLVLTNPLTFDPKVTRAYFDGKRRSAEEAGLCPVFSSERLSGSPFSGGHDAKQIAENLRACFPDDRVLVVIREQRSMILSEYRMYIRVGYCGSLRQYMNPPRRGSFRVPMFSMEFLEYDRLIGLYHSLFGAERVLVLCFEELKRDACAYVRRICEFAGAREPEQIRRERSRVGLSGLTTLIKRPVNALFVRDRVNPNAWLDWRWFNRKVDGLFVRGDTLTPRAVRAWFDRRAMAQIEREVRGRFQESNRRLEKMLGVDLEAMGYDV